jgi:hypothetical protein
MPQSTRRRAGRQLLDDINVTGSGSLTNSPESFSCSTARCRRARSRPFHLVLDLPRGCSKPCGPTSRVRRCRARRQDVDRSQATDPSLLPTEDAPPRGDSRWPLRPGQPTPDRARTLRAVPDQQDSREPRALGARGGGRDPPPPTARHVRESPLAPPAPRPARGAGHRLGGTVGTAGHRRRPGRHSGEPGHGASPLAAPDTDACGGRRAGAGPRRPRLGLDRGVRRGRLPAQPRGPRRGVGARRVDARLPRAAPTASPRSPTSPASGTAAGSWKRSGSSRRRPGQSCGPSPKRPRETASPIRS